VPATHRNAACAASAAAGRTAASARLETPSSTAVGTRDVRSS
jgi:hypothetical protein